MSHSGDSECGITCVLDVQGGDAAASSALAEELRSELLGVKGSLEVARKRADAGAQDLGSLLEIVLYAPAIGFLANGIASFLRRKPSCSIVIRNGDKSVEVTQAKASDALEILDRLLGHHRDDSPRRLPGEDSDRV